MSYHSDYHKGGVEDEEEEEDYSDEEEEEGAPPVPYKSEGYNQPQPQNPAPYNPQYADPPPTYDVYAQQSYPSGASAGASAGAGAGAGMGYDPNAGAAGYGGVGYQPSQPGGVNLQDPNKSRESNDTFV